MMLTDLADVLRDAGLTVIEVPGWRSRGARDPRGVVQAMTDVLGVTCHHTAGAAHGNAPSLSVVQHGRADLPGPLAHLLLGRNGTVYVVAAGLCNHAGTSLRPGYTNAHRIGIEAENTGRPSDPWPGVQTTAYARLTAALAAHYRFPVAEIRGHKETCAPPGRKVDPSLSMPALRTAAARYMTNHLEEDEVTPQDKEDIADLVVEKLMDYDLGTIDDAANSTSANPKGTTKYDVKSWMRRVLRVAGLTQDWVRKGAHPKEEEPAR